MGIHSSGKIQISFRVAEDLDEEIISYANQFDVTYTKAASALLRIGLLEKANYGFDISGKPFKLQKEENNYDAR